MTLLEKLSSINAQNALDVGCGHGEFTKELSKYCRHVTAIDTSENAIKCCIDENTVPNIRFLHIDGRKTNFHDKSFDLVIERASLHHMLHWDKAIDEMIRLSSKHVIIVEPLDDNRSIEKRNLNEAENLYLEVQHDAGYEHYNHIKKEILLQFFIENKIKYDCVIDKYDDIIGFDEYFSYYEYFADKTSKKEYWMKRLEDFKIKINGGNFCPNDVISIYCEI